ncbi:xanthine dehydrogenase family protein subunit M [Pseudonocardia sp.]|jgi:CO/xanthine dehydrogenase FAD-binding subunit|uniref:FAD binding domain-containing protein n=1 Tax=Pseudonocardia sp. TaxID=60912 RepID=UPI0026146A6B|nr:xanthine dehydrogenase family protein subunit M [Pseudonocardia sp.]MCW2716782.1 xanthine dehydrogenase family protein subunit [Pseudonocardia sp.]MDT7613995.1 aerobic carbon-monoxide dehydrogenase medium subunit [Pseudonocardiales bacterium]
MKPPAFTHHACRTVEEAVGLLDSASDDSKVISGGQSLVPMMNLRLANPAHLVDLNGIPGLNGIEVGDRTLTVGATARQHAVERSTHVATSAPLLAAALKHVGHPQIRNRGTVVGSLCHADPAAEMPAVFLTLGGHVSAQSASGTRTIAAGDFFDSYLTTALEPNEIATAVTFDTPNGSSGWYFEEVARRHGDFAVIGIVALLTLSGGVISDARLTVFGGAATPVRIPAAEQLLVGVAAADVDADLLARAAAETSAALRPSDDIHASGDYRRHVAGVLTTRGISTSLERAVAGS